MVTLAYYGVGGRRNTAVLDHSYFNKFLRFELIDRWAAFTVFANEVDIIEDAIKAAPDHQELKNPLLHYEKLMFSA
jgi:hypothetical protein